MKAKALEDALRRFRHVVRHASRRQWYKTRPGCYEKTSDRSRRKEAMRMRSARCHSFFGRRIRLTVYLTLAQLYSDSEPFKSRRRPTKKQKRRYPASPDDRAV